MNNTAIVRSGAWYGDEVLTLNFPTNWKVEVLGPKDAPAPYAASDGSCYHGLFDRLDYARYLRQRIEQAPPESPAPRLGRRGQLHVWSKYFLADDFYKEYPASLLFRDLEQLIQLFAENFRQARKSLSYLWQEFRCQCQLFLSKAI
jgi:hypothetical protein